MIKPIITNHFIKQYLIYLAQEEKSESTIRKYRQGLIKLVTFAGGKELNKNLMIAYKQMLWKEGYRAKTMNVFLAAANGYLAFMGWGKIQVKACRVQGEVYREAHRNLSKWEYKRLLNAAKRKSKERLYLMMKTIYSTGIRVSECIHSVTVEAVREGNGEIRCKGKIRPLLIPSRLKKELLQYIEKLDLTEGLVFRTRNGKAVDRSNFWKEMKKLSDDVKKEGVLIEKSKIFPHNLRHLFAKNVYELTKDMDKLSNLLGHSSLETTRLYVQTGYEEYRKLIDQVEKRG